MRNRNIRKAAAAAFIAGIFLMGLGTGIAFTEFSTFTYAGENQIGEVSLTTRDFDYAFEPAQGEKLEIRTSYTGMQPGGAEGLILDQSVPENTVRFRVTYNTRAIVPYIDAFEEREYLDDGGERARPCVMLLSYYIQDDFKALMTYKDQILNDIRNRRIASYDSVKIESVRIYINPATSAGVYLN